MSIFRSRLKPGLLIAVGAIMLGACGYQLRGQADLPASMATTFVAAPDDLARELRLLLAGNNVNLTNRRAEASAVLAITDVGLNRDVQSVGERARVNEYALRYQLQFALLAPGGDALLPPQMIELSRDYTLDETQILGVASEEELIRKELRREMAREIVRRLEYVRASGEN